MTRNTPFLTVYLKDPKILDKLDELHWKEKKSVNNLAYRAILEYLEKHSDGNPNYQLEQFQDPNFKACPAFFRNKETWEEYLSKLNLEEFKEFDAHLNLLFELGNRRYKQL